MYSLVLCQHNSFLLPCVAVLDKEWEGLLFPLGTFLPRNGSPKHSLVLTRGGLTWTRLWDVAKQ